MPPKKNKKGKGKKKGKKEEEFANVDKAFCYLTITDLNKKISHLRSYLYNLEEKNIALKKDNEVVTDRKDVADHLQRTLEKKIEEFNLIEKEFERLTQQREQESLEYQAKVNDLEKLNKSIKEQLTFEIKFLQAKFNSLDEFRLVRERLLDQLMVAENNVTEKEDERRQIVFELEHKALIEKDNLKKTIELQLLQLAEDFSKSNEIRASGYTRRLIRENIALHKEIEQLITVHIKMQDQYDDFVFRNKVILQNYSALEETNQKLMLNAQSQIIHIKKLTDKCVVYSEKVIAVKKLLAYCKLLEMGSECERFNYNKITQKLYKLRVIIDDLNLENAKLSTTNLKQEKEIKDLKDTMLKLKMTIELFLGIKKPSKCFLVKTEEKSMTGETQSNSMPQDSTRQNLLAKLMEIIGIDTEEKDAAVCTPVESNESLYHPGELGFIDRGIKSSLLNLFITEPKKELLSSKSRSTAEPNLREDLKMPIPCHIEGNLIENLEMGSLFIVSDEGSEQVEVKIEEEEPIAYDDGGSSSEDKQDDVICDAVTEKTEEKAPIKEAKEEIVKKESCDSLDFNIHKKLKDAEKDDADVDEHSAEEYESENEYPPFFFY